MAVRSALGGVLTLHFGITLAPKRYIDVDKTWTVSDERNVEHHRRDPYVLASSFNSMRFGHNIIPTCQ